jgi:hypothetical protein
LDKLVWNYNLNAAPIEEKVLVKIGSITWIGAKQQDGKWWLNGAHLYPVAWCQMPEIQEPPKPRRWTITVEEEGGEIEYDDHLGPLFTTSAGNIFTDNQCSRLLGGEDYDYESGDVLVQPLRVVSVEETT